MKRTFDKTTVSPRCMLCSKGAVSGQNKPHSQHRTKRLIKPNIQSFGGLPVCTACLRTLRNKKQISVA